MSRAAPAKVLHKFARLTPVKMRHAPRHLHTWLGDCNSLSARLATLGHFGVKPIREHIGKLNLDSALVLGARVGGKVLIREVELQLNQQSVVFAQSLLPVCYLTADKRRLYKIGKNSLGHFLFSATTLQRHHLCINQLAPPHRYATAWGRSQLFIADGLPVIVSEYFLQAFVGQSRPARQAIS